jgi:hypothetical protein
MNNSGAQRHVRVAVAAGAYRDDAAGNRYYASIRINRTDENETTRARHVSKATIVYPCEHALRKPLHM